MNKKGFTLIEMLLVLIITSCLFVTITPLLKLVTNKEKLNFQYHQIIQFYKYIRYVNQFSFIDEHMVQIEDKSLKCSNHQLYITPGYQLIARNIDCNFSLVEQYIYLNTSNTSFIIGKQNES